MLPNKAYVRVLAFAVLAAGLVAIAVAAPRVVPPAALVEDWVADARVASLVPVEPARDDIVILGIGEATMAQEAMHYRSPLDREQLALWIAAADQAGARAIGVDILFDQRTEPRKDDLLRRAILGANAPVIVGWAGAEDGLTPRQLEFQAAFTAGMSTGHVLIGEDAFGTIRWIEAPIGEDGVVRLPLVAAIAASLGAAPPTERFEIAYRGPTPKGTSGFTVHNAHLAPKLPQSWLAGRIVLFGTVLVDDDRHRTPFNAGGGAQTDMPGVVIHAHALAQLLDGRRAARSEMDLEAAIAVVVVAIGMGLAFWGGPATARIGLLSAAAVAFWVGGFALYQNGGPLIPLVLPSLVMGAGYGITSAAVGARLRREKRQIRRAFRHYVAPAVIRQLEADPDRLKLGGEWREVTYIFTDIAGFTTLSEGMEPEQLVPMLNTYLDGMCRILITHECTLDKFIGDAVVAVLGAPDDRRRRDRARSPARPRPARGCRAIFRRQGGRGNRVWRHPNRRPHRTRGGGKHWRRKPLRLHCHWRYRKHRGAPRGREQVPGHAGLHQRPDRGAVSGRGAEADWGVGVEGKSRGGGGLRTARPQARRGAGHGCLPRGIRETGSERSIHP